MLGFGFFFVGEVINRVGFRQFWLRLPGPAHQPLDGIIWFNFSLETKQEPKCFEPLICFLSFLVQSVWPWNTN